MNGITTMAKCLVATCAVSLLSTPLAAQTTSKGATEAREAAGERGKAKSLELICRKESVNGSRVKKRKICLTKAQWQDVADNGNAFARRLVEGSRAGMWGGS